MPVRHKASPFWAQAVKRNMYIGFACNFSHIWEKAKKSSKVHSSDGGIWLPLAMVPNLCLDKKFGFDNPRCAVSLPRIGIGQMDSKQEFFAPSDVQLNLTRWVFGREGATPRPSATDLGVDLLARGAKCGRGRSTNL